MKPQKPIHPSDVAEFMVHPQKVCLGWISGKGSGNGQAARGGWIVGYFQPLMKEMGDGPTAPSSRPSGGNAWADGAGAVRVWPADGPCKPVCRDRMPARPHGMAGIPQPTRSRPHNPPARHRRASAEAIGSANMSVHECFNIIVPPPAADGSLHCRSCFYAHNLRMKQMLRASINGGAARESLPLDRS